jgi:hypothetical protein
MTVRTFDRWLTRACHTLGGLVFLIVASVVGYAAGSLAAPEAWPYDVRQRKLITEEVEPGGNLILRRTIDYHDDCEIRYERRVQSTVEAGRRYLPPDVIFDHPPWDRSGKPQESSIGLPENFPCGPAYLVESVSVACDWYERVVQRRRKPDIITPFDVVCGRPAP